LVILVSSPSPPRVSPTHPALTLEDSPNHGVPLPQTFMATTLLATGEIVMLTVLLELSPQQQPPPPLPAAQSVDHLLVELASFPSELMELFTLLAPMLEDSASPGALLPLTVMATMSKETGQTVTPPLALLSSHLVPSLVRMDNSCT